VRRSSFAARFATTLGLLLVLGVGTLTAAAQDGTPAASPAVPTATPPPAPVVVSANEATPAPEASADATAAPAPAVQTDVVTMVLWYANSATSDIIELYPLVTDSGFVASQGPGAPVGSVDFPDDGSAPVVVLGETIFTTYPRPDGVIERWTWLDDFEGARPATLVMQLSGEGGAYQSYFGTATMMSRDEGGAGGVLILALRPPSPEAEAEQAAAEQAAAEQEAAEQAPAEEAVVAEEAPVEDAIITEEAPAEDVITEEPAA
jgi:hypothetical protein